MISLSDTGGRGGARPQALEDEAWLRLPSPRRHPLARLRLALRRLECRLGRHRMRHTGMQLGRRLEQCERCRTVRVVR